MTDKDYAYFGDWVKERREELGWTQVYLAEKVNYSVETIRKIEQRRYRAAENLIEDLARELQIPDAEYLRFRELGRQDPVQASATSMVSSATTRNIGYAWLRPALLPGALLLIMAATVASFISPWSNPASEVGIVVLTSQNTDLVIMETANGIISSGDPVQVGEVVTVTFTIRNNDTHRIRIDSLVIGARGPGAREADWSAPHVPFPAVHEITLEPGEVYEYRQSRAFYEPGDYFVEPVFQNAMGQWSGIQPYTQIAFFVTQ